MELQPTFKLRVFGVSLVRTPVRFLSLCVSVGVLSPCPTHKICGSNSFHHIRKRK
ncbi:hypothetical protein AB205_0176350 [Aquarana catesbeiana]|uniref:Uncharacterized protein n=1 Tax=Aquarana catesbeiana TaxID=8400 RepID=A0A2G9RT30_AQUCT|nr:hypothetical protein AB205_0176350 [Aquarana catesbeiana]